MRRGHSNAVNLDYIEPYPTNPARMRIELVGGANVYSVKDLPPLALSKEEWEKIGRRAGWIQ